MTTPLPIRIGIWTWLLAAVFAGYSGALASLPLPAVQGILFLLTALLLSGYFKLGSLRAWLDGLDLRGLVLFHLTRFVGVYFLLLYERGQLPYDFAVRGGWGDIIVASLALLICVLPLGASLRHRVITIWNVIGFADILMVVVTAARHGLAGDGQLRALTVLPLSLLPTFIVPVIIATHVIIFLRLKRAAVAAS
ncbi:MAG: hypothetical protein HYV95_16525 [Opitutae bacterium]|nr:hypothetical protein [Opitutae bacterium]